MCVCVVCANSGRSGDFEKRMLFKFLRMRETEYKWKIVAIDAQTGDNSILSESEEYFNSLVNLWEDLLLKVFNDSGGTSVYTEYYDRSGYRRCDKPHLYVYIWKVGARVFKLNGKLRLPRKGEINRKLFLCELAIDKHVVRRLNRMRHWYAETYLSSYYRGIITRQ